MKTIQSAALMSASVLALLTGAGQAVAQATPASPPENSQQESDVAEVETIVVTGSRTRRRDADTVGELTTITAEDLQRAAVSSVGELLQKLPSAGVSYNSNGTQGTSYGGSSISLRYLANTDGAADRTLVLVDGHRWVDGVGARGIRDFVDLNTIPIGMIGSMEILQDGASAIYGADAIAGVVNLKTKRGLDGFNVESKYGTSSRGDGQSFSLNTNWGHRFDSGSVFLSATYVNDEPVETKDRDLTAISLTAGLDNLTAPPSSPRGLYILPGFSTTAAPLTQNVGVTVATGPGNYHRAILPDDYYNTMAQGIYAVGPSERFGLFARVEQDLTDHVKLTLDAMYNSRVSQQVFSPTNLSIGGTAGTYRGFAIAANQIYNPFGVGFAANQAWNIQIFTPQVGNRISNQQVDTYRVSGELAGDVDAFARNWDWSLFGSASENHMTFDSPGGIDLEHLALALTSPAVCAAQAGCIPVNIFGQMTPGQAAYINSTARETNATKLFDLTFDVNGELFDLQGGPLAIAFGLEWRKNVGEDHPDAYVNTISTGTGALPLPATTATTTNVVRTPTANGSYDVKEAYLEVNAPLLADLPFVNKLELNLATRYSDYGGTVGSKFTSKVGIGYRPVEDLLLRGTWSEGFRAPSLIELYTGSRQTNLAGSNTDPCNGGAAAHPTLPGCAGVPSTYNQSSYNGGLLPLTVSGNGALNPETAETWSYGLAYKPHWVPGLSFTLDAYQVTITDAISTPSVANALQLCAAQAGVFCSALTRDATTGQVLNFSSSFLNLNEIKTSGYDIAVRYHLETGVGAWDAALSGTHLDEFDVTSPNPTGGAPIVIHAVGTSTGGTTPATARATYPEWKGLASLRWSDGVWGAMWRGRYIGSTLDGAAPARPTVPVKGDRVAAIVYNDLQMDRHFEALDANLTVGINNVFDKAPPISYANAPINFDIYTYDVMGRYFYVRVSKSF